MQASKTNDLFFSIKNLQVKINQQEILRGLNLDVVRGETLVLIGASGGGKSVLLRNIIGLMKPNSGEIYVDGENIVAMDEEELFRVRDKIGVLFQHGALFDGMTVYENVAFPLQELYKYSKDEIHDKVIASLKTVELEKHINKMPSELSGGMQKRAALARAIVRQPLSIIYDEPTAGLDPVVSDTINELIKHLKNCFQVTSIVITHDIKSAFDTADRIAYLKDGKIEEIGTTTEIQNTTNQELNDFINGRSHKKFQC